MGVMRQVDLAATGRDMLDRVERRVVCRVHNYECVRRDRKRAMIQTFNSAEYMNLKLSKILSGEYPDDRRVTLTLAYCDLALDHYVPLEQALWFRAGSGPPRF
jgi:hypothetical protein